MLFRSKDDTEMAEGGEQGRVVFDFAAQTGASEMTSHGSTKRPICHSRAIGVLQIQYLLPHYMVASFNPSTRARE